MILAVDLGNYNIKTSEDIIFSSRFVIGGDFAPLNEESIEYDGIFYTLEKGEFDNRYNKSEKKYLPNLLYAIGKSTNYNEIDLVLGVPLDNLDIKEKFKADLKGKTFKFKINEKDREIRINKVATIAEGVSSFYTLSSMDRQKELIIIDIGGRTTNVVTFINGKVEKKFTISKGTIDLYDSIKTRINATGNNYKVEEMERLIRKNLFERLDEDKRQFLNSIMNEIEFKLKIETYEIFFTGGGSIELGEVIRSTISKPRFVINALYSNCLGNKRVVTQKWSV